MAVATATTVDAKEVITFEGTKFFWRTRNTVDVKIVEHRSCKTFEVIVYEPTLDQEAPRIYLNASILVAKLDHADIDAKMSFAKRNNVPITEKFVVGIVNKMVSDFVLNKLHMKEMTEDNKQFVVELHITESDIETDPDLGKIVRTKPGGLIPHKTIHLKHIEEEQIHHAIESLEHEQQDMREVLTEVAELATQTFVRERWRMPIVMNKVARGKKLNASDQAIFQRVQRNMKTDEDVARMKAVLVVPKSSPTSPRPEAHPKPAPTVKRDLSRFVTVSSQSKVAVTKTDAAVTPKHGKHGKKHGKHKKGHHKHGHAASHSPTHTGEGEEEATETSMLGAGLKALRSSLRASFQMFFPEGFETTDESNEHLDSVPEADTQEKPAPAPKVEEPPPKPGAEARARRAKRGSFFDSFLLSFTSKNNTVHPVAVVADKGTDTPMQDGSSAREGCEVILEE